MKPPGQAKPDGEIVDKIFRAVRDLVKDSQEPRDEIIRKAFWTYTTAEDVLREINGYALSDNPGTGLKKGDLVRKVGDRLIATAPQTIAGKLEIRGIGIVEMEAAKDVPVALIVDLTSEIQRLPDDNRERPILGVKLPLITVDAMTASAPSKVALGLDRLGLKF